MTEGFWNESIVRSAVKIMLENRSLGPAMVNVNPVVDPSAARTDPSNPNYTPSSKPELVAAVSELISSAADVNVPDIYSSIKDVFSASEKNKGDAEMSSNMKTENAIRNVIKKMLRESILSEAEPPRPRPKFILPDVPTSSSQVDLENFVQNIIKDPSLKTEKAIADKLKTYKSKDAKGKEKNVFVGNDATAKAKEILKIKFAALDAAAREQFLARKLRPGEEVINKLPAQRSPEQRGMIQSKDLGHSYSGDVGGSDEQDIKKPGKKNLMTADEGGIGLKELTADFGFTNPNGVLQFINRILRDKMMQRVEDPEAYEIATLEAMNEYIKKMVDLELITPEDANLMKQYPQFIGQVSLSGEQEDPEDEGSFFRTRFLAPRLKKLDKAFKKPGA